ncbi:MAG: HlyC/CorC family transporter [Alistipes sp.]|nr:HlyC/CorC family transporter [Alistipes sp.]MBR3773155.1 HlyC/CorC family transporter [Alistipes sp.]
MLHSILLILLTLLFSAFFSGMEIAFTSKNRLKLELDRKQSRLFDRIASIFERHQGQYITTILVGNNIALVLYSLYMSILLRTLFRLAGWESMATEGSVLIETAVSTILIIFMGEFIPKSIFKNNPNFYYRTFAPLIYLIYLVLYPIARLTTLLSQGILYLLGHKTKPDAPIASFNHDDLAALLNANTEPQEDPDNELKLFQNALDFADQRVRDCMVPRIDVEAVDIDETTIEELVERFVESKYSRLFVYRNNLDNIIGYVNLKSLFLAPKSVEEVMMKVDFVPETMPLQALLQTFIRNHSNIAVVIDEFGGTAGIISMEDVLEEIFGEIEDEHDEAEEIEKQVGDEEFVLSCRLEVEYLNEKYNLEIEESKEYDTLAGLIIYHYEGIPTAGQTLVIGKLQIRILRTTRSRLELARVKKIG